MIIEFTSQSVTIDGTEYVVNHGFITYDGTFGSTKNVKGQFKELVNGAIQTVDWNQSWGDLLRRDPLVNRLIYGGPAGYVDIGVSNIPVDGATATRLGLGNVTTVSLASLLSKIGKLISLTSELPTIPNDYAKKTDIPAIPSDYAKNSDIQTILGDYARRTDLPTIPSDYAKDADVQTILRNYAKASDIPDDYAKESQIPIDVVTLRDLNSLVGNLKIATVQFGTVTEALEEVRRYISDKIGTWTESFRSMAEEAAEQYASGRMLAFEAADFQANMTEFLNLIRGAETNMNNASEKIAGVENMYLLMLEQIKNMNEETNSSNILNQVVTAATNMLVLLSNAKPARRIG